MITLFTAPKPFKGHIGVIQRNAIRSWLAIDENVEVVMVGSEEGMDRAAAELGVVHLPNVERTDQGTPRIDSIFSLANEYGSKDIFCYLNADVMLMEDFLPTVSLVDQRFDRYLIVGQRWDIDVDREFSLAELRAGECLRELRSEAKLHPPGGSDYFVFRRGQFEQLPPFALGRSGWDNWMIYSARAAGEPVIDASNAITVLHQDHDYNHLPGGEAHYRLPESQRNVDLAGGREMMFTLQDATWKVRQGKLEPIEFFSSDWWRRLESSLIAQFGPGKLSQATRMLFHLPETMRYFLNSNQHGDDDVKSEPESNAEATEMAGAQETMNEEI